MVGVILPTSARQDSKLNCELSGTVKCLTPQAQQIIKDALTTELSRWFTGMCNVYKWKLTLFSGWTRYQYNAHPSLNEVLQWECYLRFRLEKNNRVMNCVPCLYYILYNWSHMWWNACEHCCLFPCLYSVTTNGFTDILISDWYYSSVW